MKATEKGFTLIELVIVVVLLGLLAAVAIPRFIDVTEDAEYATVEGVAGGFATGVGLVRAQWEVDGRPDSNVDSNRTSVLMDGVQVAVDSNTGYPTGQISNDNSSEDTDMSGLDCESVFNLILQSAPSITSDFGARPFNGIRYYTSFTNGNGSGGNDLCFYYLTQTIQNATSQPQDNSVGNGFIYDPRIGQVIVFSNNN